MDYRPYILAGTFLLLIVAIATFIVVLARSRREQSMRHERRIPDVEYSSGASGGEVDTDLQGLELTVDAGAPSASLLTPLRTGEWMPPDSPARAEDLPDVSLAGRVADFVPAPAVPEPPFSIEAYQPWEVASAGDAFDEEIQALLPTTEFAAIDLTVPTPAVEAAQAEPVAAPSTEAAEGAQPDSLEDHLAALAAEEPVAEPMAAPVAEPMAAPVAEPMAAPVAEPMAAPVAEPAAFESVAPASTQPEIELAAPVTSTPAESPLERPAPEPVVAPAAFAPAAEAADLEEAQEWVDMLRETQGAPTVARPRASAPPPAVRPAVTVATAEPPAPVVDAAVETAPSPRRTRPAVRVHGVEELPDAERRASSGRLAPPPIAARSREAAEDIVMAAPVEMWFGDARVGVKAGTATYERFMKYATVLLDDLKALKQVAR